MLPSRDTPQATRSSSSGTKRPKWPSTIASAAAPHSTASIWMTVGVFTRFRVATSVQLVPRAAFSSGTTRLIGRCRRVTTSPTHNVPPLRVTGAPSGDDHR